MAVAVQAKIELRSQSIASLKLKMEAQQLNLLKVRSFSVEQKSKPLQNQKIPPKNPNSIIIAEEIES